MEGDTARRPPPPEANERPDDRREGERLANPREMQSVRVFERLGDPAKWWAVVRIPVHLEVDGPREPGALIAVSRSVWAFGNLLDTRPVIWAVVVAFLVSVVWWAPLVLGMTRAMRKLTRATETIAEGRFETRAGVARRDEIGQLGESIDKMATRLDALVNGQRKFLGDVAHELGSPIGRMQVGTSILEERVPVELQSAVADVREEVQEMSALVGELLAFTKSEMRVAATDLQSVGLRDVVTKAIDRELDGATEVRVALPGTLCVQADAGLLLRVVGNVLRNARRYAGDSAVVNITGRVKANGRIELVMADNGPGVPEEALARLGEAFYRPDAARTREAGGFGLGLSIVKSGVAAMGGTVQFGNAKPHGFVVTIEFAVS